jgi:hypothetical protein
VNNKVRIDYNINGIKDKKPVYKNSSIIVNPSFGKSLMNQIKVLNHEEKNYSNLLVKKLLRKNSLSSVMKTKQTLPTA